MRQPLVWLLLLCAFPAIDLAGQDSVDSAQGMRFDPTRLLSYSNAELIELLSGESIQLNLSSHSGPVYLLRSPGLDNAQPTHDSTGDRAVTIPVRADSGLSYLDAVIGELVRRRPFEDLVRPFRAPVVGHIQLAWLEEVFARLRGPEADSALKPFATADETDETQYFALKYFAKAGAPWALDILNCHYFEYPTSSFEWSEIVTLFGKYKYYPAGRNLATTIGAALVNLGDASLQSLLMLYPEGRSDFRSSEEGTRYWTRYVAKHSRGEAPCRKQPRRN